MLEHHLNIAELPADSQHHCPCTGAILLSYLAQPSRTFNFHMAASQPAFDCKPARDPKQELPSSAFPKVLTHKVSSKMKWLSLYKFWNNLLCSDYNQNSLTAPQSSRARIPMPVWRILEPSFILLDIPHLTSPVSSGFYLRTHAEQIFYLLLGCHHLGSVFSISLSSKCI